MRLEGTSDAGAMRHHGRARTGSGPRSAAVTRFDRLIWREHVEAELQTLRDTLTRMELALLDDRAALRTATGQWTAVREASTQWPEQINQLRAHVDRLDERTHAEREQVRDELEGLQDDIGRLSAYTLQTQVQERMINRVEAEQARLFEVVSELSHGLLGLKVRTNAVVMAGAAVALISTMGVLLANAPRFW